jgi:hypothetical protein
LIDINIFRGIHKNFSFIAVIIVTVILQVIIIEFGGVVFKVPVGGIPDLGWLSSVILGLGTLPVGVLLRCLPDFTYKSSKEDEKEQNTDVILSMEKNETLITTKSNSAASRHDSVRARKRWKKAIDKTQLQIKVLKAFREPASPYASASRSSVASSSRLARSFNASERQGSFSVVSAVRGGRANASDYISLQVIDPSEARSKAMNNRP